MSRQSLYGSRDLGESLAERFGATCDTEKELKRWQQRARRLMERSGGEKVGKNMYISESQLLARTGPVGYELTLGRMESREL